MNFLTEVLNSKIKCSVAVYNDNNRDFKSKMHLEKTQRMETIRTMEKISFLHNTIVNSHNLTTY